MVERNGVQGEETEIVSVKLEETAAAVTIEVVRRGLLMEPSYRAWSPQSRTFSARGGQDGCLRASLESGSLRFGCVTRPKTCG